MNTDIERLAKEAGAVPIYQRTMRRDGDYIRYESTPAPLPEWVAKFAALVAEECAKECESRQTPGTGSVAILNGAADAIRAKFALSDLKDEAK